MPVSITNNQALTLLDLKKRKDEGYMVEATPHIGNLGVRNLALASLGLQVKLIDSTIGKKDDIFFPHCIIMNDSKKEIAANEILTTHNVVNNSDISVTDFHTTKISKQYRSIITHSDWIQLRANIITAILEITTKHTNGSMWERYVDADGIVHLAQHNSPKLPEKIHRVNSSYDAEGWIIANPVSLLCDMICGVIESGRDSVYMISDVSMYKYIYQKYRSFGPMDQFISQLYDAVRASGLFDLPEQLHVAMIPLSCLAYFSAPSGLADELDRKLEYLKRIVAGNKRAGQKEREKKLSGKLMSRMSFKRAKAFQELNKPLETVCADPKTGIFYSQHDLLENNETIYIPESAMNTPLSSLSTQVDKMQRLMRYRG